MQKKYLSGPEMRERFGISSVTLWRWTKARKLPSPVYLRGRKYWVLADVERAETRMFSASLDESLNHAN